MVKEVFEGARDRPYLKETTGEEGLITVVEARRDVPGILGYLSGEVRVGRLPQYMATMSKHLKGAAEKLMDYLLKTSPDRIRKTNPLFFDTLTVELQVSPESGEAPEHLSVDHPLHDQVERLAAAWGTYSQGIGHLLQRLLRASNWAVQIDRLPTSLTASIPIQPTPLTSHTSRVASNPIFGIEEPSEELPGSMGEGSEEEFPLLMHVGGEEVRGGRPNFSQEAEQAVSRMVPAKGDPHYYRLLFMLVAVLVTEENKVLRQRELVSKGKRRRQVISKVFRTGMLTGSSPEDIPLGIAASLGRYPMDLWRLVYPEFFPPIRWYFAMTIKVASSRTVSDMDTSGINAYGSMMGANEGEVNSDVVMSEAVEEVTFDRSAVGEGLRGVLGVESGPLQVEFADLVDVIEDRASTYRVTFVVDVRLRGASPEQGRARLTRAVTEAEPVLFGPTVERVVPGSVVPIQGGMSETLGLVSRQDSVQAWGQILQHIESRWQQVRDLVAGAEGSDAARLSVRAYELVVLKKHDPNRLPSRVAMFLAKMLVDVYGYDAYVSSNMSTVSSASEPSHVAVDADVPSAPGPRDDIFSKLRVPPRGSKADNDDAALSILYNRIDAVQQYLESAVPFGPRQKETLRQQQPEWTKDVVAGSLSYADYLQRFFSRFLTTVPLNSDVTAMVPGLLAGGHMAFPWSSQTGLALTPRGIFTYWVENYYAVVRLRTLLPTEKLTMSRMVESVRITAILLLQGAIAMYLDLVREPFPVFGTINEMSSLHAYTDTLPPLDAPFMSHMLEAFVERTLGSLEGGVEGVTDAKSAIFADGWKEREVARVLETSELPRLCPNLDADVNKWSVIDTLCEPRSYHPFTDDGDEGARELWLRETRRSIGPIKFGLFANLYPTSNSHALWDYHMFSNMAFYQYGMYNPRARGGFSGVDQVRRSR